MKQSATRSELDSMVVGVELTLISIIQGVALTFLIESAKEVISLKQAIFWPYLVAGLLLIFVFWSRSVLHIITVIRWPLEFGHNFLYLSCALVEALLFTRLTDPQMWFALATVFGVIGWVLFSYDLRLIRARQTDSPGSASHLLIASVTRDQWLNIAVLVPGVVVCNLICFLCLRFSPDLFLERKFHVYLAGAQLVGFAGYLGYVVRYFRTLSPLIAQARQEWREDPAER